MPVPTRFVLHQGPVLAGLGRTILAALRQRLGAHSTGPVVVPGPDRERVVPPRPPDLVREYVLATGGDLAAYEQSLPPHLFPQWGLGLAATVMRGLPYPLLRIMNAGCRMEERAPLPIDAPLHVRVRLDHIDDDGSRALIRTRFATGTEQVPQALVAHMTTIVPLAGGKDGARGKDRAQREKKASEKERPSVPVDAREVARWRIGPKAGLDFAKLTGDFNPVHWVRPWARAFGFGSTILHGFATYARAYEGVRGDVLGGSRRIAVFDARFTRPLVLPAEVGLYVGDHGGVFVGDAPGRPAYLTGSYEAVP